MTKSDDMSDPEGEPCASLRGQDPYRYWPAAFWAVCEMVDGPYCFLHPDSPHAQA